MSTLPANAANADQFTPPVMGCPEFAHWAYRIALRLGNLPPGAPEWATRGAILGDGTPPPEWFEALAFMLGRSLTAQGTPRLPAGAE